MKAVVGHGHTAVPLVFIYSYIYSLNKCTHESINTALSLLTQDHFGVGFSKRNMFPRSQSCCHADFEGNIVAVVRVFTKGISFLSAALALASSGRPSSLIGGTLRRRTLELNSELYNLCA